MTWHEGSPPRVREKLDVLKRTIANDRITPACAGKTSAIIAIHLTCMGSPPRVREKPIKTQVVDGTTGITPACAGKTRIDGLGGA